MPIVPLKFDGTIPQPQTPIIGYSLAEAGGYVASIQINDDDDDEVDDRDARERRFERRAKEAKKARKRFEKQERLIAKVLG